VSASDAFLFLQQGVLSGLVSGSIYALLALSVVMIFKTTDVPNFAQGEIFMIGAFITLFFLTLVPVDLRLAIVASLVLTPLACAIFNALVLRQVQRAKGTAVNLVIATLGFGYLLKGLARLTGLGDSPRSLPTVVPTTPLSIGQATLSVLDLVIVAVSIVAMVALFWMFRYTRLGKAMRAAGMNPKGARLVGIHLGRMHMAVWALSGLLSAVAAILIAPKILVSPDVGHIITLGFAAAIIGGFASLPGAVLGGFIVGITENLVGLFVSTNAIAVAPFIAIMLVLILVPQGILGGKLKVKKV
jgi:branched-chain amino acid transport system permease protein